MAYIKQNFVKGQILTAEHMNHIEDGIVAAADAQSLGGKAPEYYLQPRNLLDNSDFRNPVNQRGKTNYTGGGYTIDRWYIDAGSCTIENGNGVIVSSPNDSKMTFMQHLENIDAEKVYTFAIKDSDGNVYLIQSTPGERIEENTSFGTIIAKMLSDDLTFAITISAANSKKFIWAALYEGSYTADTLPPYVPKGYTAELSECQRYYQKYNTVGLTCRNNGYATALLPVVMRVTPTISVGTRLLFTSSHTDVAADYPSVNLQADPNLIYFTNNFYSGFATLTCSNVQLSSDL